jgi:hypothetical protein
MGYENNYIVYVKTDSNGHITAVNSSAFLTDTSGWTEIDSGYGDKYHHAQNHYFPEPIYTDGRAFRYKLLGGNPVECTTDEILEQENANRPAAPESGGIVLEELEAANKELADAKNALGILLGGNL